MLKEHTTSVTTTLPVATSRRHATAFHMESGDPICVFVEPRRAYNEMQRFDPAGDYNASKDMSNWFCKEVESLIGFAEQLAPQTRPLVFPLPEALISAVHFAAIADEMIAVSYLCPQELSFEIADATIVNHTQDAYAMIQAFRRRGFRVSVDARKCWQSTLPPHTWLMIDTLRIDQVSLPFDDKLEDYIETATNAGVSIIADRPAWRESYYLDTFGIHYGVDPKSDA